MKKAGIALISLGLVLPFALTSCGSTEKGTGYEILSADAPYEGVGYEIFTGSFADGDGDGKGDLKGITQHVSYLKDLGIRRIWLTPFYPTDTYHGYDVIDYCDVNEDYGTLDDFDDLVEACHEAGIDVIIDLVMNHSSVSNPWFLQSAEDYRDNNTSSDSKKDWYVWSDTQQSGYNYNHTAGAYYECNFDSSMPEFNFDCEAVRNAFAEVARFWLEDHDVDGFRLDAALYFYYQNATKNAEVLSWFKETCEAINPDVYIIAEAWLTSNATLLEYQKSGVSCFDFPMSEMNGSGPGAVLTTRSRLSYYPEEIVSNMDSLKESAPGTYLANFVGNHDTDRTSGYFASQGDLQPYLKKMMASMTILTPGTPWIYYGEEIDMWGTRGSWSNDVPRRLAMVWGNGEERCANPERYDDSANQVTEGAYDLMDTPYSLTNHYRALIGLRNTYASVFSMSSTWENMGNSRAYPGFKITDADGDVYYLMHNTGETEGTVTLPETAEIAAEIETSEYGSTLDGMSISIPPYNSVLLKA